MSWSLRVFGKIGSVLFLAGFAVLVDLSVFWTQGTGIGTRSLLTFGLLAELVVNVSQSRTQEVPLKYSSDRP